MFKLILKNNNKPFLFLKKGFVMILRLTKSSTSFDNFFLLKMPFVQRIP